MGRSETIAVLMKQWITAAEPELSGTEFIDPEGTSQRGKGASWTLNEVAAIITSLSVATL